ncbi:MAG: hypothetical protein M3373_07710 [Gemmatimonadota bacterium]|nr:hypothetical protein [Gemmatimonadota bacterium]
MQVRHLTLAVALALAPVLVMATATAAQSAAEHIAMGDQAYAALEPAVAVKHYEAAIEADSLSYEALWKASRSLVDMAEYEESAEQRRAWFRSAEAYSHRAVAAEPNDAEGHFGLARSLGRVALTVGVRDRVKYAGDVRAHALEALRFDPNHPGALHVMGRWNAEVMRVSGFARFMAKTFLGGKVFDTASWAEARRFMEKAVEVDPDRLTHHLDLAEILADMGEKAKAREQFEIVARGQPRDVNDPHYKREAERALARLR